MPMGLMSFYSFSDKIRHVFFMLIKFILLVLVITLFYMSEVGINFICLLVTLMVRDLLILTVAKFIYLFDVDVRNMPATWRECLIS